jgi:hypothetical protein
LYFLISDKPSKNLFKKDNIYTMYDTDFLKLWNFQFSSLKNEFNNKSYSYLIDDFNLNKSYYSYVLKGNNYDHSLSIFEGRKNILINSLDVIRDHKINDDEDYIRETQKDFRSIYNLWIKRENTHLYFNFYDSSHSGFHIFIYKIKNIMMCEIKK